jgi:hypothetical protein
MYETTNFVHFTLLMQVCAWPGVTTKTLLIQELLALISINQNA